MIGLYYFTDFAVAVDIELRRFDCHAAVRRKRPPLLPVGRFTLLPRRAL